MELRLPTGCLAALDRAVRCTVVALALGLGACGTEPRSLPAPTPEAADFHALEYAFVTRGRGSSSGQGLALTSHARGRLTLVPIDEPPLFVMTLEIDELQLHLAEQVVARIEPGVWSLLVRRNGGAIDALWVPPDMPSQAKNLARFLVAELASPEPRGDVREEQTPAGVLAARYASFAGPRVSLGLRVRSSAPDDATHSLGTALLLADNRGPVTIVSTAFTHTSLSQHDQLDSVGAMLLVRESVSTIADSELSLLRERVKVLSQSLPISLIEEPLTDEQKDAMRRDAETWDSVRARLLATDARPEPTLLHRAAAHLVDDDALADELLSLATAPYTTDLASATMYLVLGECGTVACQAALLEALERDVGARSEVLAGLTRVGSPSIDTVDHLLVLDERGDRLAHAAAGVMLSRLAEHDPNAAALRLARLVHGLADCSDALEEVFTLLGNAGLPASEPVLRACLAPRVDEGRRAAAAGAMRRIPGASVTNTLTQLVAEDPSTSVRVAGLRALVVRIVVDDELHPLHEVNLDAWDVDEQELLLDILERVTEPGEVTAALLAKLEQAQSEDVAARARLIAETLRAR